MSTTISIYHLVNSILSISYEECPLVMTTRYFVASNANMDVRLSSNEDHRMYECACCSATMFAQPSWMSRYRALYLTETGTELSDIHTTKYDWRDILDGAMIPDPQMLSPWFLMSRIRPTKVLLFHELCWSRLLQYFDGEKIDLDRIFEVCRHRWLDLWIFYMADLKAYDFESQPRIPKPEYTTSSPPTPSKALACVQKFLRYSTQIPRLLQLRSATNSTGPDCFSFLPTEINLQIAIYLDTLTFFDLRYVSRAMANIFNIQSFWKSRFQLNQDRGYLNYLINNTQNGKTDWRLTYRRTADLRESVRMKNYRDAEALKQKLILEHLCTLKDLWMHAQWFRERYTMIRASDKQISLYEHLITDSELCWKEFYAGVQCDRFSRQGQNKESCHICWTEHIPLIQAIPLQNSTIGLAVSVLRERMTTVITGFELLGDGDIPNLTFGYRIPGRQVIIDLHDQKLTGFTIFSSKGHIHALRPIFQDGQAQSSWIGQPTVCEGPANRLIESCNCYDKPKMCRGALYPFRELCHSCVFSEKTKVTEIVLDQGITALCGKFDYCKMIGLAIA